MKDNEILIHAKWILEEIFTNLIFGIVPGKDVSEDEYGAWLCERASVVLVKHFLDDKNMTVDDAMKISNKLMLLIGYEPKLYADTPDKVNPKDEYKKTLTR